MGVLHISLIFPPISTSSTQPVSSPISPISRETSSAVTDYETRDTPCKYSKVIWPAMNRNEHVGQKRRKPAHQTICKKKKHKKRWAPPGRVGGGLLTTSPQPGSCLDPGFLWLLVQPPGVLVTKIAKISGVNGEPIQDGAIGLGHQPTQTNAGDRRGPIRGTDMEGVSRPQALTRYIWPHRRQG